MWIILNQNGTKKDAIGNTIVNHSELSYYDFCSRLGKMFNLVEICLQPDQYINMISWSQWWEWFSKHEKNAVIVLSNS